MLLQNYLKTEVELQKEARPTTWRYEEQSSADSDFLNTKPPQNPSVDEHYLQFLAQSIQFSLKWLSGESFNRRTQSDVEQIFSGLAKQWQDATSGYSITTRRYFHPAYKAILLLKEDAVPLILRELEQRPDWWFDALETITKVNPVSPEASFEEAADNWIAWGKENKRIPNVS